MSECITLYGWDAIEYADQHSLGLSKHADPTDGAREGLTAAEAAEIAKHDCRLVYLLVPAVRVEISASDEVVCEAIGIPIREGDVATVCDAYRSEAAFLLADDDSLQRVVCVEPHESRESPSRWQEAQWVLRCGAVGTMSIDATADELAAIEAAHEAGRVAAIGLAEDLARSEPFVATHVAITDEGTEEVMVVDGTGYTRHEWDCASPSRQLTASGEWLLRGQPSNERVLEIKRGLDS